jgi:hypothetical protein
MRISLRTLIVADSEDDTALLVRELRGRGYEITFQRVETAAGLKAALPKTPGTAFPVPERRSSFVRGSAN